MFYFVYKIVSDFSSKFYRFIISASIAVIFIPLAFMLSYFLWILSLFIYIPTSFTSERWNSAPNQRFEISRSLIYGKHLRAKNTEEVQALLGKPSTVHLETIWVYNIGTRPSEIDPDFIEIYFNNKKCFKIVQVCEGKEICNANQY